MEIISIWRRRRHNTTHWWRWRRLCERLSGPQPPFSQATTDESFVFCFLPAFRLINRRLRRRYVDEEEEEKKKRIDGMWEKNWLFWRCSLRWRAKKKKMKKRDDTDRCRLPTHPLATVKLESFLISFLKKFPNQPTGLTHSVHWFSFRPHSTAATSFFLEINIRRRHRAPQFSSSYLRRRRRRYLPSTASGVGLCVCGCCISFLPSFFVDLFHFHFTTRRWRCDDVWLQDVQLVLKFMALKLLPTGGGGEQDNILLSFLRRRRRRYLLSSDTSEGAIIK